MFKPLMNRFIAAALLAIVSLGMTMTSFEVEAKRMGGGMSFGRQSGKVMQRSIATPRIAPRAAAAAAAAGAATSGARSGLSRWLGPIAGIATGLGIAALLSHFGLAGAMGQFFSSLLLIGLVVGAIVFIFRRLRQAAPIKGPQTVYANADSQNSYKDYSSYTQPTFNEPSNGASINSSFESTQPVNDNNWFIPSDFDTVGFLHQAKEQFVRIQTIWDTGDATHLREFLTDDLIAELKPQIVARAGSLNKTEVVLLNAELLGLEEVADGHLASVRFSGMLREAVGTQAEHFEEVWNIQKLAQGGWLLAGIQQVK